MLYRIPVTSDTNPAAERAASVTDTERLARLHFHLKTGDYFPTLATILGFIEETVSAYPQKDALPCLERELIQSVRKDLMYLHEYYQIDIKPR